MALRALALCCMFYFAASRWYGLYSACEEDAACGTCVNSTLYIGRCDYVGGPGMMSTINVCNTTTHEFVTLEFADTPDCSGASHPDAVPTNVCLTGPFGEHLEYHCGTVPYVPAPPPGGIYGQIVIAETSDTRCNDSATVEWEWFTPGACTSPKPFASQIIDCDVARGSWSWKEFDSEDCTGSAAANKTGRLNVCLPQPEASENVMIQCDTKPIPPP
jgi:hypothetical protein